MLPFNQQQKKNEHKRQNMDEFDGRVLICFWQLMYLLLSQHTIIPRFYGYEIFHSIWHPNKNFCSLQLNTATPIACCEFKNATHTPKIALLEHSIFSTSSIKAKCLIVFFFEWRGIVHWTETMT